MNIWFLRSHRCSWNRDLQGASGSLLHTQLLPQYTLCRLDSTDVGLKQGWRTGQEGTSHHGKLRSHPYTCIAGRDRSQQGQTLFHQHTPSCHTHTRCMWGNIVLCAEQDDYIAVVGMMYPCVHKTLHRRCSGIRGRGLSWIGISVHPCTRWTHIDTARIVGNSLQHDALGWDKTREDRDEVYMTHLPSHMCSPDSGL